MTVPATATPSALPNSRVVACSPVPTPACAGGSDPAITPDSVGSASVTPIPVTTSQAAYCAYCAYGV
ncbi:hypothetical protein [Amycolatopsis sp. SID8362]|uniref:hypothetical protein n=1 Tax=Amycolatopsis sp. SID8362 TaxID=2690346 RepID=UPI001941AF47|nr:hypothetical protein [Amycolatopsis sp. SID8362]